MTKGLSSHFPNSFWHLFIPSVARNLVVSPTERLEKQILRFAQDDPFGCCGLFTCRGN